MPHVSRTSAQAKAPSYRLSYPVYALKGHGRLLLQAAGNTASEKEHMFLSLQSSLSAHPDPALSARPLPLCPLSQVSVPSQGGVPFLVHINCSTHGAQCCLAARLFKAAHQLWASPVSSLGGQGAMLGQPARKIVSLTWGQAAVPRRGEALHRGDNMIEVDCTIYGVLKMLEFQYQW